MLLVRVRYFAGSVIMSTCYEYNRLKNYLRAIEDDKVEEYHNERHHKEKKKI